MSEFQHKLLDWLEEAFTHTISSDVSENESAAGVVGAAPEAGEAAGLASAVPRATNNATPGATDDVSPM